MHFTDIFIKRPVLATVISLVILLLGLRAAFNLTVREYPFLQNAQINIMVAYPGADPALMEGFVTTPLEREVATADGIDFLSSSTSQGVSTITANLRLNKDPSQALTEISAKVNKLRNQLPQGSEDPIISIEEGGGTAAMYLSFHSKVMDDSQITDYLTRVIEPQLSSIPGVGRAEIMGARTYAMRVWLKSDRMAAHNLTASEVFAKIRNQNVLSAVGETKGNYVRIGLSAKTDLHTEQEFRDLVIQSDGSSVVRLGEVAEIKLGAESYDGGAGWDGDPALFVGIRIRPEANVLDVIETVNKEWPGIVAALPQGLEATIGFDSTVYIRNAIKEVEKTLIEAIIVVIAVIFLFLGSMRNSFIPAITVPLSLIGALFVMMVLGYTINLLTLLAMVLAIGMVVDDAIIVMENIHRHIEDGMKPYDASIRGARELVGPVIAMTITLVAVYAPIGFLTGITGKLFAEFAFTLAGAVLISGVLALTLTPMMCSKLLKPSHGEGGEGNKLAVYLDRKFEQWRSAYKVRLHSSLNTVHVIGLFGLIVLVSCVFLFMQTPKELAPEEDRGFAFSIIESDGFASQEYQNQYLRQAEKITLSDPDIPHIFSFSISSSQAFMGMAFKPWSERTRKVKTVLAELAPKLNQVPAMRIQPVSPPPLPTPGQGYPVEFVLKATAPSEEIAKISDEIIKRAADTHQFFYITSRMRIDRPETTYTIDRSRAALMGVDMSRLSADLSALLSGGEANRFSYDSRSYKIIPQLQRDERLNPDQIDGYYTRAGNGQLVPISSLITLNDRIVPRAIEHAQQLNADTIVAVQRSDITQGEALKTLEDIAAQVLPAGYQIDYSGPSRQFKSEGSALMVTFAFALIIIYLVLAAQFESFRDPIIMLVTVPMSVGGALLFINLLSISNMMQISDFPGMTLNIYTQVGLVTLIGVISKHGILIVEFANKLQQQGLGKREAIEEASSIRLRPVLMTTAALVIGMLPLLLATGPGAAARFSMGVVIASGMTIGTLFTLYIVPAMYLYLGRDFSAMAKATVTAITPRTKEAA